jgi:N-acetyl-gamma-glutamyl-phosphate reductase
VREVRETHIGRIRATVEPATGRVLVFSAIDNLWKGAAGQAVQDLNLMLGLPETEGLGMVAGSAARAAL